MLNALQFVTVLVIQVMVGFVTPGLVVPHTVGMVVRAIKVSAVPVMRGLEAEKTALLSAVVAENKWSLQNPVSNTK